MNNTDENTLAENKLMVPADESKPTTEDNNNSLPLQVIAKLDNL